MKKKPQNFIEWKKSAVKKNSEIEKTKQNKQTKNKNQ
jgi:hypothetical protein